MKVAIIGTYPPQKDGIGIYSSRIAEVLKRAEHKVRVFSFKGNERGDDILGCLSKHNPFSYISTAFKLHRFKPDKVLIQFEYVHYNLLFFPMLLLWLKLLGYKINFMVHTIAPYNKGWKAWVIRMVHLCLFLFTDKVFLHTQVAKQKLLQSTWIKPSIEVLPIAIPIRQVKQKLSGNQLMIFGFISSDKGIDLACKAVGGLDVKLTIAGTVNPYAMKKQYSYLKEIKQLVKGKKNITLINKYTSDKDKDALFRKTDFFLLPYRFIEQSAVMTEVWGYGKIPICSDIPSFKEEVKDKYGVLFKSGSVADLRQKIKRILGDKKKQQTLLLNINQLAKERSFAACSKQLVKCMV